MTDDFAAQLVLARLNWGRDGARSIHRIARDLDMDRREVERHLLALVEEERKPIVACGDGVYLAQTREEVLAYAKSLQRRAIRQFRRPRALRRVAQSMRPGEQTVMFLDLPA